MSNVKELMNLLNQSYSTFHVIDNLEQLLKLHGFTKLLEQQPWNLEKDHGYYVVRNNSSLIAFYVGANLEDYHYQIVAAHSDSPTFKLKRKPNLYRNKMTLLNTEGYGGMLCAPWFDRPLSIAGRVMIKNDSGSFKRLVNIDEDLLMIPSCSIHLNREANTGMNYNKQKDLLPLFSSEEVDFMKYLADYLDVDQNDILAHDLFLYPRGKAVIMGANKELIAGSKLDNLLSVYSSFLGLVSASCNPKAIQVCCAFDNEETGSLSKQGASSTFLKNTLTRINEQLGYSNEHYLMSIAKSFMISIDNAQGYHPNYPEKYDQENHVLLNKGIGIKYNANQKYTSDAISSSVFELLCNKLNVNYQYYVNRSDILGGSTLGTCTMNNVSLHSVDIGIAQLAMHSSYELAGVKDVEDTLNIMKTYYESNISIINESDFMLQ